MKDMKKIITFLGAIAIIAIGCTKMESEARMNADGSVTVTTTVRMADSGTKALTEGGVKTFAVGEQIAVVYTNTSEQTVKATSAALTAYDIAGTGTHENKMAIFTVTLNNPKAGTVRYVYPASMVDDSGNEVSIASQNGTLATLQNNYDYAYASGSMTVSGGSVTLPENVTLSNQFAIGKFTLKDYAGTSNLTTVTGVTITDGTNTYTVTPASTPMSWPIYVVMKPVSSDKTITITATDSDAAKTYSKAVIGKTLSASHLYPVNVAMVRTVNLASITSNFTADNGDVFTGTLGANVKISISAGATVTLNDVTINGVHSYVCDWAGITCLGNATIILGGTNTVKGFNWDYPGVRAGPTGTTLTIQGSGLLTASPYDGGAIESNAAGIGCAWGKDCGNIVIEGGTISATGGSEMGAGIGSTGKSSCGNIEIKGGEVTAEGGAYSAGIGSSIHGGYASSCGNITITSGVTRVTATKGSNAPNSIGAGNGGTCGTVTIGGVEGAITTSPYTYPPVPTGAINGLFTINAGGEQVYFSQGNLQYVGTWRFAAHQYDIIGNSQADNNRDLFGWGTKTTPNNTSTNAGDYSWAEWGENTITNGTTGYRTLTTDEWAYLFNTRGEIDDIRYAKATVNGIAGVILVPDNWSTGYYTLAYTNDESAAFTSNTIDAFTWANSLEAHGAVFLPAGGSRNGESVSGGGSYGIYWSSSWSDSDNAYYAIFSADDLGPQNSGSSAYGLSVRLVKEK